ncbi:uncharacterized protein LOC126896378 [Daktulosphaira vitifoliae]|uniref:uncharacterized protein LOC126896378 n=1 Tax=Daktulosphaira vitifoliae TaxID=58002 RepID=UPI0021AA2871|nr:uncharacterized protein LOC126896378 [Daktulosphaira vitifoliae]
MSKPQRWSPHSSLKCDVTTKGFLTLVYRIAVVFCLTITQFKKIENVSAAPSTTSSSSGSIKIINSNVPPVVRAYDAVSGADSILLACVYTLNTGGEEDSDQGNSTSRHSRQIEDLEEYQMKHGIVVRWYFRSKLVDDDDEVSENSILMKNEVQVYQWIAGHEPKAGSALGPFRGRVINASLQPSPASSESTDKNLLYRIIKVTKPTSELTGEYQCMVEDWNNESRSEWHPMVVYTPERVFEIEVHDGTEDDDENDEESLKNGTTSSSPKPKSSTTTQQPPSHVNVSCYAAGIQPAPSMTIWVNNMLVAAETQVQYELPPTTSTPKSTKPVPTKSSSVINNTTPNSGSYYVKAHASLSLREPWPSSPASAPPAPANSRKRRLNNKSINQLIIECRLRVPGMVKSTWPADHYYQVRKSKLYTLMTPLPADFYKAKQYEARSFESTDMEEMDIENDGSTAVTSFLSLVIITVVINLNL